MYVFFLILVIIFLLLTLVNINEHLTIVSSHYKEDLNWLKETDLKVVVCSKVTDNPECPRQENKGREVTSYLQFIITNYDDLPSHVAFIHGHQKAWHQKFKKPLLEVIKCADYENYGYISLNNKFIDDRDEKNPIMVTMKEVWDELFRPYLDRDCPTHLYHDCCAQFIVSKELILKHPKETYQHWFDYVIKDEKFDDGGYKIGKVFEYLWAIIFGEEDVITKEEYMKRFKC